MMPKAKRVAALYLVSRFGLSKRHAFKMFNLNRFTDQYNPKPKNNDRLRERMKELAGKRKRFGSPMLYVLLKK